MQPPILAPTGNGHGNGPRYQYRHKNKARNAAFTAIMMASFIVMAMGGFVILDISILIAIIFMHNIQAVDAVIRTLTPRNRASSSGAADWRAYAFDLNVIYYNPNINFNPWPGPCLSNGQNCADANFFAALE